MVQGCVLLRSWQLSSRLTAYTVRQLPQRDSLLVCCAPTLLWAAPSSIVESPSQNEPVHASAGAGATAQAAGAAAGGSCQSVADIVAATPDLKILSAALSLSRVES